MDEKTLNIEARVSEAIGCVLATWELRNKAVPLIELTWWGAAIWRTMNLARMYR
jgi:hypothetical protein